MMMQYPLHKMLGWSGTAIALCDYGAFAAGLLSQIWFFGIGAFASSLLVYALFKDRVQYGWVLQGTFLLLNVMGMVRILWG